MAYEKGTKKSSKIYAVIPTHNRRNLLKNILDCLHAQLLDGVSLNIVVVVDGSDDGTLEMLSIDYPGVLLVVGDGNWWYTKSINQGIQCALTHEPDYVLTLNDDCSIDSDYIQNIYDDSLSIGSVSLIGSICLSDTTPQIIFFAGVKKISWLLYRWEYYYPLGASSDSIPSRGVYPTVTLPGRGMLIPASTLKAIGFFDEGFPQYGSDEDFSLRAVSSGINSFISYRAIVYSCIQSSDKSSAFLKNVSISIFIKSLFRVYSSNYLGKEIKFVFRHGYWWGLPIALIKILVSRFFNYFGRQKV